MNRTWLQVSGGIALGEVTAYAAGTVCGWLAAAVGLLLLLYFWLRKKRPVIFAMTVAFLIGFCRMKTEPLFLPETETLDALCLSEAGTYTGRITGIEEKKNRTVLTVGQLLVYPPEEDETSRLAIGNVIRIRGRFRPMERARNPGGFDSFLYYRSENITHSCFAQELMIVVPDRRPAAEFFRQMRCRCREQLRRIYDEADAGIYCAALLGDKSLLEEDLYALYQKNGIAHLLAISGLHVSILGMSFYALLRKLGMGFTAGGLIAGAWLIAYSFLTGSGVSTVRAVIMLLILFLSGREGRRYDLLNAAGLAASGILLYRPYQLFGCGFLLSFGAVLGIGGPAQTVLNRLGIAKGPIAALVISGMTQLFTLPVLAWFFFEIPLYAVLLNLIVIPLMTYVVWSGLAALALSCFSLLPARIAAGSGHFILAFYRLLCEQTAKLPGSRILIGRPSLWQIVLYYAYFFAVLYWRPSRTAGRRLLSWMWARGMAWWSGHRKKPVSWTAEAPPGKPWEKRY